MPAPTTSRAIIASSLLVLVRVLVLAPAAWAQPDPDAPSDGGSIAATVDAEAPAPVPPDPDAPTVGASLDRAEGHVGDRLTLTVTAVAAGNVTDTVKLARPELGKFEILDSSEADQDLGDGRKRRRFVLQIAAYEIGDFEIPSVTVSYKSPAGGERTLKTSPIAVAIGKVVDDPNADLQPLAHTREVQVEDRRPLQAAVALGVLIALIVLFLVTRSLLRRRRKRQAEAPPVTVTRPAHEIALERLAAIARRGQFAEGNYQPFHFELAEVVRGYLGARYGFDSLELTTTELLEELGRARTMVTPAGDKPPPSAGNDAAPPTPVMPPPIGEAEFTRVGRFLEECDLVKFAKAGSTDEAAGALLGEAEALVRATMLVATVATLPSGAKVANG